MTIAMKRRRRTTIGDILLFILMVFIALIMVVPFFWMLITSFKENGQVLIFPPQWIPNPWRWDNYSYAWNAAKMGLYFRNSAIVTVLITIGQTVTCSLAAFAFSRLEFKGRDTIFLIYLGTMMIPIQVTLIPLYIIMKNFGWNDSFQGLIVPFIFSAYNTFLLRQSFLTLPKSLDESAIIDGCGYSGIFFRIILPLSKPALITQAIFCSLWAWNDLLWPTIIANTDKVRTLVVGLQMFKSAYAIQWNYLMAGTCISIIPMLLLYMFCQRYFVEGIALTGIKG
jgi:multiple sugar transport system permease protein